MKLRRRTRELLIETLDRVALDEILRAFEDAYAEEYGERITSAEFYDRYRDGDAPEVFDAIRWASYYEL